MAGDEGPGGLPETRVYQTRRRRSGSTRVWGRWLLAAAALLIGAGGAWFWWQSRADLPAPSQATPAQSSPPVEEVEETLNVPPLDESDPVVSGLLSRLSDNPEWARWLLPDDLVRRFVVAVVNVAQGESPRDQVEFMEPDGDFEVRAQGEELIVDPASFRRYDLAVATFLSLDTDRSVRYYRLMHPLFEEAHAELGLPDRTFDQSFAMAVDNLLAVRVPTGQVPVVEDEAVYEFADPALAALTPADHHLLRLGPENARAVQNKLNELAVKLGLR